MTAATDPITIDALNALPRAELVPWLLGVCHAQQWADEVADARPFADRAALLDVADRVWLDCGPADWLAALDGHPRIGERGGSSAALSRGEQAGMDDADALTRAAIAQGNLEYEERFGHVFLIAAAGRSPQDILGNLESRMDNPPDVEVEVAAQEHRRITALRLEKLVA